MPPARPAAALNDTHRFDPSSLAWSELTGAVAGPAPAARYGHGFAAAADNLAYLFGGVGDDGRSIERRAGFPEICGSLSSAQFFGRTKTKPLLTHGRGAVQRPFQLRPGPTALDGSFWNRCGRAANSTEMARLRRSGQRHLRLWRGWERR